MRAVPNATVTFQLIEMGHETTPARAITIPGMRSYYKVRTRCDGSFRVKLTGNDAILTARTLWEERIYAVGFELGPYDISITGSKLDLNIMGPRGTFSLKAKLYWGTDIPPFRYGLGCHIRKIVGAFL